MAKKSTAEILDLSLRGNQAVKDFSKLFSDWRNLELSLKRLKNEEMNARRALADFMSEDPYAVGKYEVLIDNGTRKIVLDQKHTASVDNDLAVHIVNSLVDCPPVLRSELLNFRASLSMARYNKLSDNDKVIMSQAVTFKPATPSIKVETIKSK